jgi:hypothetical protein
MNNGLQVVSIPINEYAIADAGQTIIRDISNNYQKALDYMTTDHSAIARLSISRFNFNSTRSFMDPIDTITFSVQPQNAISFQNSSNIAVFSQPGGYPAIQSVGPGKNIMSWQGVFYNSGRATSVEQKNIDKYQYDLVKKLEGWQNNGETVTITFGPIVVDAVIENFSYAIKRMDLIQYQISLIIDEQAFRNRKGFRPTEKYWANGSIDPLDLLGGPDSPLGKIYKGTTAFTNRLIKGADAINDGVRNISNNINIVQNTYGDMITAPAQAVVDIASQIDSTVDIVNTNADAIGLDSVFKSVMQSLKGTSLW